MFVKSILILEEFKETYYDGKEKLSKESENAKEYLKKEVKNLDCKDVIYLRAVLSASL
jgi:hypothetical protein